MKAGTLWLMLELLIRSSSFQPLRRMTTAKIVTDIEACGERLRQGKLVAFPTETVYGLGCHALNETAIHSVFHAKERPLTDPLIVHVENAAAAFDLWQVSPQEEKVISTLCQTFWPGPLTLVAKARSNVPDCLMANTGFVACRSPSHEVARQLLKAARVAVAAPSANKFGHVSPTTAAHVLDDLHQNDVWILDDSTSGTCHVGVESTVAKLDDSTLTVLRQGAVSVQDLTDCLQSFTDIKVLHKQQYVSDEDASVAPGQSIRHYSPNVASFILAESLLLGQEEELSKAQEAYLSTAVLIDYGQQLPQSWQRCACAYRDLSPTQNSSEAAQTVFDTLRWAEQVPGAKRILFCKLHDKNALALAVQDRLTRAASGVVIDELI
jgi:L-threonylcarbamoyladenylate synthase